jgi:osmotically-inducible protein OsmY
LKTIVYSEASKGDCVLIGRGAFALLSGVPGVINLRVVSPLHVRVGRVKEYYKCDDRHAEQIIHQSDRDREGYHRYFFGVDSSDPENFQAVVNTGGMDAQKAVSLVSAIVKSLEAGTDRAETDRRLSALNLSQSVITMILYTRKVPIQFLEADVQGGLVTLHGVAASKSAVEAAGAAAREVLGVADVVSEIQVVQEYASMP